MFSCFQSEGTNDNTKMKHRLDEKLSDETGSIGSRRRERPVKDHLQSVKKVKESSSRTSSRDRYECFVYFVD